MTLAALRALLENLPRPVVLLEGTREVPDVLKPRLEALAAHLAREFPHAIFRSGNADGADFHFARGVARVDVSRLQLVVPKSGHRIGNRPEGAAVFALEAVKNDWQLVTETLAASREYDFMARNRSNPKFGEKFNYLLRDTLKVAGENGLGLARANVGIFLTKEKNIGKGGTAHTLRVCEISRVPVITQQDWLEWDIEVPQG